MHIYINYLSPLTFTSLSYKNKKILVWIQYLTNVSSFYKVIHSFIFNYHSFFVKLRKELLFFEKTLKKKQKEDEYRFDIFIFKWNPW